MTQQPATNLALNLSEDQIFSILFHFYKKQCNPKGRYGITSIQRICKLSYPKAEAFRNIGLQKGCFIPDQERPWLHTFNEGYVNFRY